MAPQEQIGLALGALVREKSRAGQLVKLDEIVAELAGQGLLTGEADDQSS